MDYMRITGLSAYHLKYELTSFVFRLGVDRDELEPDLEGGRSFDDGFKLLEPGLSPPFNPILSLSRSRDSID